MSLKPREGLLKRVVPNRKCTLCPRDGSSRVCAASRLKTQPILIGEQLGRTLGCPLFRRARRLWAATIWAVRNADPTPPRPAERTWAELPDHDRLALTIQDQSRAGEAQHAAREGGVPLLRISPVSRSQKARFRSFCITTIEPLTPRTSPECRSDLSRQRHELASR
jgi:hypothetical protein